MCFSLWFMCLQRNKDLYTRASVSAWLQEMLTEASFYLFNATKRRVFFRTIQILIPATWTAHDYSKVKQESYEKVRI